MRGWCQFVEFGFMMMCGASSCSLHVLRVIRLLIECTRHLSRATRWLSAVWRRCGMDLPQSQLVSKGFSLGTAAAVMVALGYPGEIQDNPSGRLSLSLSLSLLLLLPLSLSLSLSFLLLLLLLLLLHLHFRICICIITSASASLHLHLHL